MPRVTFKKQIKTRVRHKIKNVFQFHHFPFSYLSDSVPIFLPGIIFHPPWFFLLNLIFILFISIFFVFASF
jgi:hypothetical protein